MAEANGNEDLVLGAAIVRGIGIGVPVVLVGLSLGIWLITGRDLVESIVTALLPGVLLGAFGGGFAGVAMSMRE